MQGLEFPLWNAAEKDDAVGIGHDDGVGTLCPGLFDLCRTDFDNDDPQGIGSHLHRIGKVIPPFVGCRAKRKVAPQFTGHGLLEIRPEAKITPYKGAFRIPVAGGDGQAALVHKVGIGCPGQAVDDFHIMVGAGQFVDILGVQQEAYNLIVAGKEAR